MRGRSACLHGSHGSVGLSRRPPVFWHRHEPASPHCHGAALGVAPAQAGLMMSLFMLGFAVAPLFYGPAFELIRA